MSEPHIPLPDEPTSEPALAERRAAPRYECDLPATSEALGSDGSRAEISRILNISATGIGLLSKTQVKPGSILVIKLQSANLKLSRPLPVRVMHATVQDGEWLLGCAFVRKVNEDDLQGLL
jgi:hypothetical protein